MIQLQVLNKVLDTGDASLITFNNLDKSFFSDYEGEFLFIKSHLDQYGNIPDKATFLNSFPQFDILEVKETNTYLLDALYDDRNKRILAESFNKVRSALMEDNLDKALELYRNNFENLVTAKHLECVDIIQDTSRYDRYVERTTDFTKFFIKTGLPELDESINGGWDRSEELATIVARPGVGKCLAKGTKVLMADGTLKKVEDVKVGDKVQSLNSINTVLGLHSGESKGYKIIPHYGDPFIVSENHILTLMHRKQFWDPVRRTSTTSNGKCELIDISVEDFIKLKNKRSYLLYKPSIDYGTKDLKIPPYILGIWLGDGTSCRVEITSMDEPIIKEWESYAKSLGLKCRKSKGQKLNKSHMYEITSGKSGNFPNTATQLFKDYNLLNNKHIPIDYMTGDRQQRLELLAGILDTDGSLLKYATNPLNGNYEISQHNRKLLEQIAQLARGLGMRVSPISEIINKKYGTINYRLRINGFQLRQIPLRLERKNLSYLEENNSKFKREYVLDHFKIEEIPYVNYYGFEVDGDHRFMLWDNTLTHNSWLLLKTAVAAAQQGLNVGLYSGEMSEDKVGFRMDTLAGHISNTKILRGNADIMVEYKKYLENIKDTIKGSLKIITPAMINGIAGVQALRAFIEKENLDMLCVDQYSLLEDDKHAKNQSEQTANIAKDLKALQTLKKIPIIAVSQQNRESTENGVGTENVALSDKVSQYATILLFLEQKDDILTVYLGKVRDSRVGKTLKYAINLDKGIFEFIPEEIDATNGIHCEDVKNEYEIDEHEGTPF